MTGTRFQFVPYRGAGPAMQDLVAGQIDLKVHRELWDDIEDVLVSRSRRHEKRIPLEKVKASLVKAGKLARG